MIIICSPGIAGQTSFGCEIILSTNNKLTIHGIAPDKLNKRNVPGNWRAQHEIDYYSFINDPRYYLPLAIFWGLIS